MMKFNADCVKEKCGIVKRASTKFCKKASDITFSGKCDSVFGIKSAKTGKDLFNVKINFDKDISLLKLIGLVAGIMAIVLLVSGVFKSGKKCKSSKNKDIDA